MATRTLPLKKPYSNKSEYDPGRFRHQVSFGLLTTTPDGAGGSVVAPVVIKTVKAIREKISEHNQLAIEAGASYLTQDIFFTIRYRKDFYPTKDMIVTEANKTYTLRAVIEIDEPVKYLKLLCVKTDGSDQGFTPSS